MRELKVCIVGEILPNEARQIELDDHPPLAVYNLDGEYFVTDDTCTHGEASLAEGDIDGEEIICPFHYGKFDIKTGEVTAAPCSEPIATYQVIVKENVVYALLEE